MADQDGLHYLARLDLPGRTHRVLYELLARLDFDNFIHVSQTDVANTLGLHRSHVSSAIRQLIDAGILIRGPRVGVSWTYRLDPNLGWKGRASQRAQAQRDLARRHGLDLVDGGQQQ